MADVKPFKAIRPKEGLEQRIAALPYDVYSREEAKREVEREPLSFLRVDRAETQFTDDVDAYADMVYEKARDLLWEMVTNGELVEETGECYYVYELVMDGRSQTGIAACSSVDDYLHQVIRKHENTREDKEIDRIRHVDVCKAQTGPIFLAYRSHPVIQEEMERARKDRALYDFTASDGIIHRIWKIEETGAVERIRKAFQEVGRIYIADGHHRCASAVKVALKRKAENPCHTGKEEYNRFLSVLFPDKELMIMDYNRVVKDRKGKTKEEILSWIGKEFSVERKGKEAYKPKEKGKMGMYMDGGWYELSFLGKRIEDPVEALDVSILQDKILKPLFCIEDPKTDAGIQFVGGIRGTEELEKRADRYGGIAFSMYPTDIGELFAVADAGLLMPPKSTWFEPKLRSGLFIHKF